MQALSTADLLTLWEQGQGLHSLDQGLLALSAVLPEVPPENLADWPLGQRNRALLDLHCTCFNSSLLAWASCDHCGETMEFELNAPALIGGQAEDTARRSEAITVRGHSFRIPTSRDLAKAAGQSDPRAAAICLIERCRTGGGEPPVWSEEDVDEVGEAMAQADPMAETQVSLRCPACGNESAEAVDLASFVWSEIEARARRLLWEIHALASAYGWAEREILSLSEARRSQYLGMVQA
jgi:hypothetical protein